MMSVMAWYGYHHSRGKCITFEEGKRTKLVNETWETQTNRLRGRCKRGHIRNLRIVSIFLNPCPSPFLSRYHFFLLLYSTRGCTRPTPPPSRYMVLRHWISCHYLFCILRGCCECIRLTAFQNMLNSVNISVQIQVIFF